MQNTWKEVGAHMQIWKLYGYDTFSGDEYSLDGPYFTEEAARAAAWEELQNIEKLQPTEKSGGQAVGEIQDRIYIERSNGTRYRFLPE